MLWKKLRTQTTTRMTTTWNQDHTANKVARIVVKIKNMVREPKMKMTIKNIVVEVGVIKMILPLIGEHRRKGTRESTKIIHQARLRKQVIRMKSSRDNKDEDVTIERKKTEES